MADFLGKGFEFPMRLLPGGSFATTSEARKVEDSIRIILGTAPGERLMRHDFGCGIHELVFEANTAVLRGAVREKVRDALHRYEPRIDVLDIMVESAGSSDSELRIDITFRLRRNNAVHNMVYPFYLDEGRS